MNLRNILIPLGIAVVAIVATFLLMPGGTEPSDARAATPPDGEQSGVLPKSPSVETAAPEPVDWKRFSGLVVNAGAGRPQYSAEDFERFIAKRGDSAANLVTAFEESRDRKWLERALELHPNAPLVLIAAITDSPMASAEVRLEWIERLKAADASNPVAWILSAHERFKNGRHAEAIADASAALERPAFYMYQPERIATARALYESKGMPPLEAELIAAVSLRMPLIQSTMAISKVLETSKTSENADAASIAEAARIQYGLGKIFQTPEASRTVISQLVGISLETKGLAVLPAAEQERRKAEIATFKESLSGLTDLPTKLMASQDRERLAQYVRRLRTDGELEAMRWLQTLEKK